MRDMCCRVSGLLVVCVVLMTGARSFADVEVKLPEGPPKLEKTVLPIKVYSWSGSTLSMGVYGHELPIDVAPARGGFVPSVSLRYDSNGERNGFGKGWQLSGIDRISRSLRRGVPRYVGPNGSTNEDPLDYVIGQESGALVFVESTSQGLLYRPRSEKSTFAVFFYDQGADTWTVRTQDGVVRQLGTAGAKDMDGSRVFAWHIAKATHPDGYEMVFTHELEDGNLFVKQIDYDLGPQPSNYPPKVVFSYVYSIPLQEDTRRSYRKGYAQVLDRRRLETITVYGSDEQGVQSYRYYELYYGWDDRQLAQRLNAFTPKAPVTAWLPWSEFSYSPQPWDWAHVQTIYDPITDPGDPARAAEEQRSLRAVYTNPQRHLRTARAEWKHGQVSAVGSELLRAP